MNITNTTFVIDYNKLWDQVVNIENVIKYQRNFQNCKHKLNLLSYYVNCITSLFK